MSGPRDFVPIWVWPAFWASDAYWLARRKLVHVAWIAGILAHGRRKDDDG